MPDVVVTNAGPLIALAKLNLLHLLASLYGKVQIPVAVYEEAIVEGMQRGFADAHTLQVFVQQKAWTPVSIGEIPADLQAAPLDRGEQEAIALALARNGLLLMDEEPARQAARQRGLTVRGTLGVLIEAYRRGLITTDQLRLYFQQIQERDDIWISPRLCQRLLRETLGPSTVAQPEEAR
jgi:predicted nucleic acid-binding protein